MKGKANTKYTNFWSKKRVEAGLTLPQVAKKIGKNDKTTSAYFTGFLVPHRDTLHKICDIFGVSYDIGEKEFDKAHREYLENKGKGGVKVDKTDIYNQVIERIYGKVPCQTFIDIMTSLKNGKASESVLEVLYANVDFDTFMEILPDIKI